MSYFLRWDQKEANRFYAAALVAIAEQIKRGEYDVESATLDLSVEGVEELRSGKTDEFRVFELKLRRFQPPAEACGV